MTFKAIKGGTVYGMAGHSEHLIILCSDPVFYGEIGTEAVLSVNVSSWREGSKLNDPTCILDVGDHPFIRHKSFCVYSKAVPLNVLRLEARVTDGTIKDLGIIKPEILERVIKGLHKSPVLSGEARVFLKFVNQNKN